MRNFTLICMWFVYCCYLLGAAAPQFPQGDAYMCLSLLIHTAQFGTGGLF